MGQRASGRGYRKEYISAITVGMVWSWSSQILMENSKAWGRKMLFSDKEHEVRDYLGKRDICKLMGSDGKWWHKLWAGQCHCEATFCHLSVMAVFVRGPQGLQARRICHTEIKEDTAEQLHLKVREIISRHSKSQNFQARNSQHGYSKRK